MANMLIIGPGRVGTTLARAFVQSGHSVVGAVNRADTSKSGKRFMEQLRAPVYQISDGENVQKLLSQADLIWFCISDSALPDVVLQFANRFKWKSSQLAIHTAGAIGLDVFLPLTELGVQYGAMHPLQTFVEPIQEAEHLKNIHMAISGNDQVLIRLQQLASDLGAHTFTIHDEDRARYHAAAALASNALVGLIHTAASLLPAGAGFEALLPLVEGTVHNLRTIGLPNALTGPIERGDIRTVAVHLEALAHSSVVLPVYLALGQATTEVAYEKGSIDINKKQQFHALFERVHPGLS